MLNLEVSDVTQKQWGYLGQSYILRFNDETNDIFYRTNYWKKVS